MDDKPQDSAAHLIWEKIKAKKYKALIITGFIIGMVFFVVGRIYNLLAPNSLYTTIALFITIPPILWGLLLYLKKIGKNDRIRRIYIIALIVFCIYGLLLNIVFSIITLLGVEIK